MSGGGTEPRRDDTPDLTVVAADDALLDILGRGGPAPDGDKLAGVLAAWRTELDDGRPADVDFDVAAILSEPADDPGPVPVPDEADPPAPDEEPARPDGAGVPVRAVPSGQPRRLRPGRRVRRYVTGLAAAGLLIGGLSVGAGQAGPESPLWPVARVLYPDRSDLRLAEYNIGLAREAVADGRHADARRRLDRAAGDVERVDDAKLADRLRAQIEQIRRTLPPSGSEERDTPVAPTPSGPSPPPTVVAPTPPGGQGQPGGGQPGVPGVPGGGTDPGPPGGGVPGGPAIPVPTLPVPIPIPTPPLPSLPPGPVP